MRNGHIKKAPPPPKPAKPPRRRADVLPDIHNWKDSHGIHDVKQRAFLTALAATGNKTMAARISGISKQSHYNWMGGGALDSEIIDECQQLYRKAVKDAEDEAGDLLEYRVRQMAMDEKHPQPVAAFFLLKGLRPAIYREKWEMPVIAPQTTNVQINLAGFSNDKLRQLLELTALALEQESNDRAPEISSSGTRSALPGESR